MKTPPLYKHTIVIWSETNYSAKDRDPNWDAVDDPVEVLVRESRVGDALLSHFSSELVAEPRGDIDFPDTDFFDDTSAEDPQLHLPLEDE